MAANATAMAAMQPIESQQGLLAGLQIFLLAIALIMCALRIYSRLLIVHSLGPDDYIMVVASVLSTGLAINSCLGTKYGWGLHTKDIQPRYYSDVLLTGWIAQVLFTLTTSTMKLSILTFYLRLANTAVYRRVIYASITWLCVWCLTFLLLVIFQCNPISAYWIPSYGDQNSKCFVADVPLLVNGVTNILNDLFIYVLPMPMLWRVQLPRRQRIGLLALFGLGSIVCVAGALRVYYSIATNDSRDGTWVGFELWTWEAVEVDLGIACACAPALKPLLLRWFPQLLGSVFGRTTDPSRKGGVSGLAGGGTGHGQFIAMESQKGGAVGVRSQGGWADEEGRAGMGSAKAGVLGMSYRKEGESEESLTDHYSVGTTTKVMAGKALVR